MHRKESFMENKSFSVADQSVTPDNLAQITDEIFNKLSWQDVNADAFAGFLTKSVVPSPGPEGVTVFIGAYPLIDENALFALSAFFSDGETEPSPAGLRFQRARVGEEVRI